MNYKADGAIKDAIRSILRQSEKNPAGMMVTIGKLNVHYRDVTTLMGNNWLNDVVVNAFIKLICLRSEQSSLLPKVYAFPSQWCLKKKKTACETVLSLQK